MDFQEALKKLEDLGTEQNRKIYRRHGISNEIFGVSYANLGKLAKEIKKDHRLARRLWETENHDARLLATMIAEPKRFSSDEIDEWSKSSQTMLKRTLLPRRSDRAPLPEKKRRNGLVRKMNGRRASDGISSAF